MSGYEFLIRPRQVCFGLLLTKVIGADYIPFQQSVWRCVIRLLSGQCGQLPTKAVITQVSSSHFALLISSEAKKSLFTDTIRQLFPSVVTLPLACVTAQYSLVLSSCVYSCVGQ